MSDSGLKVPSQVFRWFEKMKSNYENSVQATLRHFEKYNTQQQDRLDKSHQETLSILKQNHANQLTQSNQTIDDLKQDIDYYKQQIAQQQLTIEKLNARYDKAINHLLTQQHQPQSIKEIFDTEKIIKPDNILITDNPHSVSNEHSTEPQNDHIESIEVPENKITQPVEMNDVSQSHIPKPTCDALYNQGVSERQSGHFNVAIECFTSAAELGCAKSMGALARAYFIEEGVIEDHVTGLYWLIKAANLGLEQAINKVESYKLEQPDLYESASYLLMKSNIE